MDLALTEQQELMMDTARAWLRDRWDPAVAGPWIDGDELLPRMLWEELAGLGWLSLATSEARGGLGGGLLDLLLLQEELGRVLFPPTFASTAAFARLLDRRQNLTAQQEGQLRRITDGSAIGTLAVVEATGQFLGSEVVTRVERRDGGWLLNGEKWFVRDAEAADCLAVLAVDDGTGDGRIAWVLVERGSSGMSCMPLRSTGRDRQYRVQFANVAVEPEDVLRDETMPNVAIDRVRADLMLLECAYLVGVMAEAHDLSIRYARERVQFGRPIGTFQAIQHKVADMTTDLEAGRLITQYASGFVEQGGGLSEAAFAKLWVSEAAQRVLREAQQIHGGIGYIVEHPLHRYFRRAKTGELMHGAPHELVQTLGRLLLDHQAGALP